MPPGVARGTLLVGLVVAAWAPAWAGGTFIWDSEFFVRLHPALTAGWPGLRALWTTFGADPSGFVAMRHYWPVLYTTFWVESALWGAWAPGYHATNVALHALNACLAWRLLAHFRVPGAWWAAAVFALHPGQVEPVAWIIGRKDVLAGTFVLLAVTVWLRWLATPSGPRLCLLLLLYVLGVWSKSFALVLPVLLLVLRWWTAGRLSPRDLRWWAPLAFTGTLLLRRAACRRATCAGGPRSRSRGRCCCCSNSPSSAPGRACPSIPSSSGRSSPPARSGCNGGSCSGRIPCRSSTPAGRCLPRTRSPGRASP